MLLYILTAGTHRMRTVQSYIFYPEYIHSSYYFN